MKDAGMSIAMVETGSNPGHGRARYTYEKAGFELWVSCQILQEALSTIEVSKFALLCG